MAKTICFFNNKGGVGKTTTSTNVAAGLSQFSDKRVLYIDLDPQCNSTLVILGEEKVTENYWSNPDDAKTILDVVEPILDDEPSIFFEPNVINKSFNRFGVDLIMGHPKLSTLEDRLGEAWVKIQGGDIGPIRKTNWCYDLLKKVENQYDYIIIDLGPSLGALNRSALIACDYFITPMSIDVFSIVGLRNIHSWFGGWFKKYERGIENLTIDRGENFLDRFNIKTELTIDKGCLGYTSQSYSSRKNSNGEKRPTKAYESILAQFDEEFLSNIGPFFHSSTGGNPVLGQVPNMFSIAPIAQKNCSPIRGLKSNDGIFGAHYSQAKEYAKIFDGISQELVNRLEND
ncbi:Helicase DnaB [Vibrio chagasii]|nr:Helicase DnaB [Vibrio chagasii]CAH7063030.1 Helicase DnaB [Vibrio chagasii]CAH7251154.1 Helicase DnaB [Vibrio chagasii]CAH7293795.1 Helicase DnaB [Vibrio chagasii]